MYDPFVVEVFDGAGDGPDDLCCVAASRVESSGVESKKLLGGNG